MDCLLDNGFEKIDSQESDLTLASFCVVNQAWYCFASLLQRCGRSVLESKPQLGVRCDELPGEIAEECDLVQEYEQIVAWYENQP